MKHSFIETFEELMDLYEDSQNNLMRKTAIITREAFINILKDFRPELEVVGDNPVQIKFNEYGKAYTYCGDYRSILQRLGINLSEEDLLKYRQNNKHSVSQEKTSKQNSAPQNDLKITDYIKTKLNRCLNVNNAPARGKKVLMYCGILKDPVCGDTRLYCTNLKKLTAELKDLVESRWKWERRALEYEILNPEKDCMLVNYCTDNNSEIWGPSGYGYAPLAKDMK